MVTLLENIHTYGSINQAAKAVGMSYKAAWERVESINNLSLKPLTYRQVGGMGGGGTIITEQGMSSLNGQIYSQEYSTVF